MRIGYLALVLAGLLPVIAEETGSVEGRVSNGASHIAIPRAFVTIGPRTARSDASGTFRIDGLRPGSYTASFQAPGFMDLATPIRVESITPVHVEVQLIPYCSIRGLVLDDNGNPISGIPVEITAAIRGTGRELTQWQATTDSAGRYGEDGLPPGSYLVMARPTPRFAGERTVRERPLEAPKTSDGERRAWVRTYYPSATDRRRAARLVLAEGARLTGIDIYLAPAPVYAMRGIVYDADGKPARSTIKLISSEAVEGAESQVQSRDGFFEFSQIPSGDWRVIAEADSDAVKLRGSTDVMIARHDLENVVVRLAAPFRLAAVVEGGDERTMIELYSIDEPFVRNAYLGKASGPVGFPGVYPGRYRALVSGIPPGHYLETILLGDQNALGNELVIAGAMLPLRVVIKARAGTVSGRVENGNGKPVLVLPQEEDLWDSRFIRQGSCDAEGRFEVDGLRPGVYYAAGLERIGSSGLDDLATLRRIAAAATRVQVEAGRTAYVELKPVPWPD